MLAVIDEATDHAISVWDWQKSRRVAETKVHPSLLRYLLSYAPSIKG